VISKINIERFLISIAISFFAIDEPLYFAAPAPDRPRALPAPVKITNTTNGFDVAMNPAGSWAVTLDLSFGRGIIVEIKRSMLNARSVSFSPNRVPQCVSWSNDGKYIACGYCYWSGKTPKKGVLPQPTTIEPAIAKKPISDILILFDSKTGKHIRQFLGHRDRVDRVAFSPDSKILASVSMDKTLRLWEVSTGRLIHTLVAKNWIIRDFAFSPSGKKLITVGDKLRIWEIAKGKILASANLEDVGSEELKRANGDGSFMVSVAHHPRKELIAIGIDCWNHNVYTVQIWDTHDMNSFKIVGVLRGLKEGTKRVAFHPDGRHVAAGDGFGMVYIWDLVTKKKLHSLNHGILTVSDLCFSANGKRLAVATAGEGCTVTIWDFTSRKDD
jgi:WD40 repeat protein